MITPYIFWVAAVVFLLLASIGMARGRGSEGQARTWLLIGVIFAIVGGYLVYQ